MKMPEVILDRVGTMSTQELYSMFILLRDELSNFDELHDKVRYGIKVHFRIFDLWCSPSMIVKQLSKKDGYKVYFRATRKWASSDEFELEKLQRREIMMRELLNNMAVTTTLSTRGGTP